MMTHQHKLKLAHGYLVHLVRLTNHGREAYCYLAVDKNGHMALQAALKHPGTVDMNRLGAVLAAGFGKPSQELMRRMEQDYGVDHAAVPWLAP